MSPARAAFLIFVTGCASANMTSGDDDGTIDATEIDAVADVDAADDASEPDAAAVDAAMIDAAAIDAAMIDAMLVDARVDAAIPVDAGIDAMCTPTWHDILANGGFDSGVPPWTQTSTIIRDSASMPFAAHAGGYAAELGASNNANDVIVQTVTVPAGATGLRVRGYQCFVTEDPITDADSFTATLETPGGTVLENLYSITNSGTAPICLWQSFTWTSSGAHAGETIVLRMRGRTNLAFLTRFIVDTMSLEWLGC